MGHIYKCIYLQYQANNKDNITKSSPCVCGPAFEIFGLHE